MRVVLDPNVLVSARISPRGVPAKVLEVAEEGRYEVVVSERLLAEVDEVLRREKFRRYLPEGAVPVYLERLRSVAVLVDEGEDGARYTEDPDDDYLIVLSLSSGAGKVVSGDRHLLSVEGEELPEVVSPAEFLKVLDTR